MQAWYNALSSREKQTLLIGGILLTALLFWTFVWQPVQDEHHKLTRQVEQKQALVQWMQQASQQVKQLQTKGSSNTPANVKKRQGNPQIIVDKALKQFKLDQASPSLKSKGKDGVKLSLKSAPFNTFISFLQTLETKHGLQIDDFSIRPSKTEGAADISVSLSRQS